MTTHAMAVAPPLPEYQLLMDNPKVMQVLIDSFCKGFTDSEACLAANIGRNTLYDYIKLNPEFGERKEELKKNPILTAKSTVVSKLSDDDQVGVATAKWYLERRTKEFRPPDKSTNIQFNSLNLLTESQLKDRLALKLDKLLSTTTCDPNSKQASNMPNDNDNVSEGEIITADNLNNSDSD